MPIFKKTAKGTVKYFPIPFAFAGQSPDYAKLPAHTSTLPATYRAVCRFRPHKRMPDCIGHRGPHAVRNAVSSKMPVQSPGKPPALSDKNIQPDILPADTPALPAQDVRQSIYHTAWCSSTPRSNGYILPVREMVYNTLLSSLPLSFRCKIFGICTKGN